MKRASQIGIAQAAPEDLEQPAVGVETLGGGGGGISGGLEQGSEKLSWIE